MDFLTSYFAIFATLYIAFGIYGTHKIIKHIIEIKNN